jgi:hypothetical protein
MSDPTSRELYIALFERKLSGAGEDGYLRLDYDFSLSDFGGILPTKGDLIVPPIGSPDPTKYPLFTVVDRFFRPAGSKVLFTTVALVVTEREGKKEEAHLIVGGG